MEYNSKKIKTEHESGSSTGTDTHSLPQVNPSNPYFHDPRIEMLLSTLWEQAFSKIDDPSPPKIKMEDEHPPPLPQLPLPTHCSAPEHKYSQQLPQQNPELRLDESLLLNNSANSIFVSSILNDSLNGDGFDFLAPSRELLPHSQLFPSLPSSGESSPQLSSPLEKPPSLEIQRMSEGLRSPGAPSPHISENSESSSEKTGPQAPKGGYEALDRDRPGNYPPSNDNQGQGLVINSPGEGGTPQEGRYDSPTQEGSRSEPGGKEKAKKTGPKKPSKKLTKKELKIRASKKVEKLKLESVELEKQYLGLLSINRTLKVQLAEMWNLLKSNQKLFDEANKDPMIIPLQKFQLNKGHVMC